MLLYVAYPWAESFIFMSSTLNPLIYCWRNREIRSAVFRVVSLFNARVGPSAFMSNIATVLNDTIIVEPSPPISNRAEYPVTRSR